VPEPGKPQALNRYSYVEGNPLGYADPSGHQKSREQWEKEYCAAHGGPQKCAPSDQDWWDYLFSIQISDFAGWIATYDLRQLLYAVGASFTHQGTLWTMQEIAAIGSGIGALSNALGSVEAYLGAIGRVTFRRLDEDFNVSEGFVPAGSVKGTDLINVYNRPVWYTDLNFAIVHELAHKWDDNWNLSQVLRPVLDAGWGTPPTANADAGYREDWADSVACFLGAPPSPGRNLSPTRALIVSYFLRNPTPADWMSFYRLLPGLHQRR